MVLVTARVRFRDLTGHRHTRCRRMHQTCLTRDQDDGPVIRFKWTVVRHLEHAPSSALETMRQRASRAYATSEPSSLHATCSVNM